MVQLPRTRLFRLWDAVVLVTDRCECKTKQAKSALLDAFRSGQITARGSVPLSAFRDIERAWSGNPETEIESIDARVWSGAVNWKRGRVGRYREITVERSSVERWLEAPSAEGETVAINAPSKPQRSGLTDEQFTENYIRHEKAAGRAPTKSGLDKAAKTAGRRGGRDRRRAAFDNALKAAAPQRGRPRKSRK